eukprot:TRINITY_DN6586_c0_g1_i7.p1 TRINITY_DN6586_c0_g1~~TRINITY_DN6586_c0_g1_i7.p1  ORF type:complete len:269 (-),score=-27.04 TRINITY_DN6586_c0_g1_i7:9-815(-)
MQIQIQLLDIQGHLQFKRHYHYINTHTPNNQNANYIDKSRKKVYPKLCILQIRNPLLITRFYYQFNTLKELARQPDQLNKSSVAASQLAIFAIYSYNYSASLSFYLIRLPFCSPKLSIKFFKDLNSSQSFSTKVLHTRHKKFLCQKLQKHKRSRFTVFQNSEFLQKQNLNTLYTRRMYYLSSLSNLFYFQLLPICYKYTAQISNMNLYHHVQQKELSNQHAEQLFLFKYYCTQGLQRDIESGIDLPTFYLTTYSQQPQEKCHIHMNFF